MPAKKKPTAKDLVKPNNYMSIKVGYHEFIVPFKEGIQIMEGLQHVEILDSEKVGEDYINVIRPVPKNNDYKNVTSTLLAESLYQEYRLNALLIPEK